MNELEDLISSAEAGVNALQRVVDYCHNLQMEAERGKEKQMAMQKVIDSLLNQYVKSDAKKRMWKRKAKIIR